MCEAFQDNQSGAQAPEVSKPTTDDSEAQPVTNYCFKPSSPNVDVWEKYNTDTVVQQKKTKTKASQLAISVLLLHE